MVTIAGFTGHAGNVAGGIAPTIVYGSVVADDESVFLTSGYLTEAALDRNIELGLLVRRRSVRAVHPVERRAPTEY